MRRLSGHFKHCLAPDKGGQRERRVLAEDSACRLPVV